MSKIITKSLKEKLEKTASICPNALALGQKIRMYRRIANMNQKQFGEALNVSSQQIHKYENGTNELSFKKICLMASILNISIENLISGIDYSKEYNKNTQESTAIIEENNIKFFLELSMLLKGQGSGIKKKIIEFKMMILLIVPSS